MDGNAAYYIVKKEVQSAITKFPSFRSEHEGLSIIQEEFEELKAEIYKKQVSYDKERQTKEATHLAAMAMRFLIDLC